MTGRTNAIHSTCRSLALATMLFFSATTTRAQSLFICQDTTATEVSIASGLELEYSADGLSVSISGVTYALADIDSITFTEPIFPQEEDSGDADDGTTDDDDDGIVYITYASNSATVTVPGSVSGVTYEVNGADVTITNENTTDEVTFSLSGTSSDGSLTYNGSYKCTLILNGLDLTSQTTAAINVLCGKRIAIELAEGTTNTLADCTGGEQKACLYVKGHAEFSKAGTLTIVGNTNHAIKTGEYCLIKKTLGSLNITGAANDGIHAGQYFKMNGGALSISGTTGDGIQAEVTDDDTDEYNGQMIINGGTIDIVTVADTCDALKADSLLTINDGTITITASGDGSKGIKAKDDMVVNGGTITITTTGAAISTSSGDNGNGMGDNDNNNGNNGGGGTTPGGGGGGWGWAPARAGTIGGESMDDNDGDEDYSYAKAVRVAGDLTINDGTINITTSEDGAEGLESKANLTINGGYITLKTYDDAINAATTIVINDGYIYAYSTGNDAVDCNGTSSGSFELNGGVLLAYSAIGSPEEGIDIDTGYLIITGGYLFTIGCAQNSTPPVPSTSTAKQPTVLCKSLSISKNYYYSIQDSDGNNIFTIMSPFSLSGDYSVITCPEFTTGSTYYLKRGTAAPTGASVEWNDFYVGGTVTTSSTLKTFSFTSNYVSK